MKKWTGADWCVALGALGYFLFPIDLIPDIFFPFGYLDDAAVVGWAINHFANKRKKPTPLVQTVTVKRKASHDDEPIDVVFEKV